MLSPDRPQGTRARSWIRAFAALAIALMSGCGPVATPPEVTISPSPSTGLSVPTGDVPQWVQCALDQGFWITRVDPPEIDGDPPRYVLESDYAPEEGMAIFTDCRNRYAPYHEKTTEELRVIYDRWVDERDCLIGLGYRPAEPPSFETFVSDWRTGPWSPIDGVDTSSWTDAEYREAKDRCTLEFFSRD